MLEKMYLIVSILLALVISAYLLLLVYGYFRKMEVEAEMELERAFRPVRGAGKKNQNACHDARRERLKKVQKKLEKELVRS